MKISEYQRVKAHVGIARRRGTRATLTLAEWEQTIEDFNGLCAYCLTESYTLIEHFVPVSIAGTHVRNCIPACSGCNKRKKDFTGDKLIETFGEATIQKIAAYLDSRIESDGLDQPVPIDVSRQYVIKNGWKNSYPPPPTPNDPYQWITQVARDLQINRATLSRWIKKLSIKKYEFVGCKLVFISTEDAHRIKEHITRSVA